MMTAQTAWANIVTGRRDLERRLSLLKREIALSADRPNHVQSLTLEMAAIEGALFLANLGCPVLRADGAVQFDAMAKPTDVLGAFND